MRVPRRATSQQMSHNPEVAGSRCRPPPLLVRLSRLSRRRRRSTVELAPGRTSRPVPANALLTQPSGNRLPGPSVPYQAVAPNPHGQCHSPKQTEAVENGRDRLGQSSNLVVGVQFPSPALAPRAQIRLWSYFTAARGVCADPLKLRSVLRAHVGALAGSATQGTNGGSSIG